MPATNSRGSHRRRMVVILVLLMFLAIGPSCLQAMTPMVTPTADAAPITAKRPANIVGYAYGSKWTCAGKFDDRGHTTGVYCNNVPVTLGPAYWLNNRLYLGVTKSFGNGAFAGWYVRFGYGKNSWRDSRVKFW